MTLPWIEQAVVARAQAGDEAAFSQLYDALRAPIQAHFYRMTWNWALAEDLAADVWLKVWLGLPKTSHLMELRFVPWLFRIATNKLKDHFRHESHVKWQPWDETVEGQQAGPDDAVGAVLDAETQDEVRALLDGLEPLHRDVLEPTLAGLSYNETAARLHMTRAGVKSRLYRARQEAVEAYAGGGPRLGLATRPRPDACPLGVQPLWSRERAMWRYHVRFGINSQPSRNFGTYDTVALATAVLATERALQLQAVAR